MGFRWVRLSAVLFFSVGALGAVEKGDIFKSSVGGRYILEERLGRGYFGTVWQVQNLDNKQRFAAKFFKKQKLKKKTLKTYSKIAFLQEVGHLPHLLRVYRPETFQLEASRSEDELPVVRTELAMASLENLESELRLEKAKTDWGRLERINDAWELLQSVLSGILEMKRLELNHHDLNPRNILYVKRQFKIGDLDEVRDHGVRPNVAAWEGGNAPGLAAPIVVSPYSVARCWVCRS